MGLNKLLSILLFTTRFAANRPDQLIQQINWIHVERVSARCEYGQLRDSPVAWQSNISTLQQSSQMTLRASLITQFSIAVSHSVLLSSDVLQSYPSLHAQFACQFVSYGLRVPF